MLPSEREEVCQQVIGDIFGLAQGGDGALSFIMAVVKSSSVENKRRRGVADRCGSSGASDRFATFCKKACRGSKEGEYARSSVGRS